MNARVCPALGARRTNALRGAGRKVVTATSRRVAAVTSAEYKARASPAVDPGPPNSFQRSKPLAVRSLWRAGTTSRASHRLRVGSPPRFRGQIRDRRRSAKSDRLNRRLLSFSKKRSPPRNNCSPPRVPVPTRIPTGRGPRRSGRHRPAPVPPPEDEPPHHRPLPVRPPRHRRCGR